MSDVDDKLDTEIVFKVAGHFWRANYRRQYPAASAEDMKAAWEAEKSDYRQFTAKTLKTMKRNGLVVTETGE